MNKKTETQAAQTVPTAKNGVPDGNQRSVSVGERTSIGVSELSLQAEAKDTKIARTSVYCGPSVRGVARQYTVYAGALPAALEAFLQEHPAARGLLVGVERFAQVRSNLGRSGTAEAILYQKVKLEL